MEVLNVEKNQTHLFERLKQWLGSSKEVLLIAEGDTFIIKRGTVPSLDTLVSDSQTPPMDDIVREVKSTRRQKL